MAKMLLNRLAAEVFDKPLMIHPAKLAVIMGVIGDRLSMETVDIPEAEFKSEKRATATFPKKISVIPISGSLVHKTHGLDAMSGLQSYNDIRQRFQAALAEDSDAILFDIDSPGGDSNGVLDLADEIYQARMENGGSKPIYASANESAYSAAYAIASAADKIFLSRTAGVGSVGVIGVHRDQSEADVKAGLKYTTMFKGARKADFNPHEPLSPEAKAIFDGIISDHYDDFVELVARNRGLKTRQVKSTEAGFFIGEKAIQQGLADEVVSFSEVPARILEDLTANQQGTEDNTMPSKDEKTEGKEEVIMDVTELRSKYPDLVAQLESSAKETTAAEFDAKLEQERMEKEQAHKENDTLNEKVLRLEKAEAIRQERDIKADAELIWTKALAGSDIPTRLHDKVRNQVSHDKFVADNILDREGFANAVKDEVKDWEKRGATSSVMGTGFTSREVEDSEAVQAQAQDEADEKLAEDIFAAAGGNRKEVK